MILSFISQISPRTRANRSGWSLEAAAADGGIRPELISQRCVRSHRGQGQSQPV